MTSRLIAMVMLLALGAVAGPAPAQEAAPPPDTESTSASAPKQDDAPPSLDDLLGIEPDETDEPMSNTDEAAAAELQRRLDAKVIDDEFKLAILRMHDVAKRLKGSMDIGIETQRAQEEIMRRLDSLMDEARRQQSQQSNSSQSGEQEATQQDVGQQSTASDEQSSAQAASSGTESQEGEAPPPQQGDLNANLDEERSEWGHLPDRVREMLLQGRREEFSSLYERMTREYYRRLAEEGS